jgi:hypothetical protein
LESVAEAVHFTTSREAYTDQRVDHWPVKLFEYFAGGKPVVVTPMDEARQYPGVLRAEGATEFAAKLDKALNWIKPQQAFKKSARGGN